MKSQEVVIELEICECCDELADVVCSYCKATLCEQHALIFLGKYYPAKLAVCGCCAKAWCGIEIVDEEVQAC